MNKIFHRKKNWLQFFRFHPGILFILMEQNTLLRFEDTVEEGAIVRAGILRNRAFSGCCNDSNRTPGWVALLSRGRINIMCRGLASSSHTPNGGSADDKAFSRPWKDKEARSILRSGLPEGIRTKMRRDRYVGADSKISFFLATSFRDAIELLFTGRERIIDRGWVFPAGGVSFRIVESN